MKKTSFFITVVISIAILFYPERSNSLSTGSPGGKTGSPSDVSDCTGCHSNTSIGSGATITTNIPSTGYTPGTIYTITATINNSASALNGFEVTSEENTNNTKTGTFFITNATQTQLTNSGTAVTHKPGGNSNTTWDFDWEAPNIGTGDVTFYGAFIEAGYPAGNSGDVFNAYTLSINESAASCTVEINNGTVDIEICDGDTAVLEATTGFDSYIWTLASVGTPLGTSNFIEVDYPGTYIVIATDTNNCVDLDSIEVIVYPETPLNPITVPAPPIICLGDSLVIEVNIGFIGYWWNTGNPNDTDQDRVVVYPTQDFVYVVEALDSNGCESREEIEVFVDTCTNSCTVEINNGTVDIEICDGDTTVLEATTGFDSYVWTLASVGTPLGTSHFIEVDYPGTYIVTAIDSINSCVDVDSIEVIVYPETPLNPMTVPNPPIVCLGDSVAIEVNSGFVNYDWNTGNPLDQDQDRVVVYPTQDFVYVVEALDSNGCESREEIEIFVDTCATLVSNINRNNILIYPNPTKEIVFINLNNSNLYNIEIIDILGNILIEKEKVNNLISIKTSNLSQGIYFIRTKSKSDSQIHRIIVER